MHSNLDRPSCADPEAAGSRPGGLLHDELEVRGGERTDRLIGRLRWRLETWYPTRRGAQAGSGGLERTGGDVQRRVPSQKYCTSGWRMDVSGMDGPREGAAGLCGAVDERWTRCSSPREMEMSRVRDVRDGVQAAARSLELARARLVARRRFHHACAEPGAGPLSSCNRDGLATRTAVVSLVTVPAPAIRSVSVWTLIY